MLDRKIWFVVIRGKQEGPFTKEELFADKRLTPDTLAWKPGLPTWMPLRNIPELKDLFEEKAVHRPPGKPSIFEEEKLQTAGKDALILENYREPPPWILWLIFALLLLFYTWLKFR